MKGLHIMTNITFAPNEEKTAFKPDLAGAIKAMNTNYLLSIKDGEMTEEAWDNLTRHITKIESVIKQVQAEYYF